PPSLGCSGAPPFGSAVPPELEPPFPAPPFVEPPFADPAFAAPPFVDPALAEPAFAEPPFVEPAFAAPPPLLAPLGPAPALPPWLAPPSPPGLPNNASLEPESHAWPNAAAAIANTTQPLFAEPTMRIFSTLSLALAIWY